MANTVRTTNYPASPEEAKFYNDSLHTRIRRISWGAILAGVAISLVVMFALNMLGLSIGAATINPTSEAEPVGPGFAAGTMIWLAASNLLALFAGGFVAGHMSGLFDDTDGALHGLVTWAVVTLISLFAITTSVGSVVSGALSVASNALSAAGQVAGEVAPEVADALNLQDMTWQGIQADVRNMMQNAPQTGVSGTTGTGTTDTTGGTTGTTTGTTDTTGGTTDTSTPVATSEAGTTDTTGGTTDTTGSTTDTTDTNTGAAGANAISDMMTGSNSMMNTSSDESGSPREVMSLNEVMFNRSLSRLLMSDTVNPADRDEVVAMLAANTGVSEAEARATVESWEQTFMEVRQEAEETARQAAQAAADAITAFAGAVFAVMVVSAFAAGVGGMTGTPERRHVEVAGATITTP
jgi:hypothetical protein